MRLAKKRENNDDVEDETVQVEFMDRYEWKIPELGEA